MPKEKNEITVAVNNFLVKKVMSPQKIVGLIPIPSKNLNYKQLMNEFVLGLSKASEKILVINICVKKGNLFENFEESDYEESIYSSGNEQIDILDGSHFIHHISVYRKFMDDVRASIFYKKYSTIVYQFRENIVLTNPDLLEVMKDIFIFVGSKRIYKEQLLMIEEKNKEYKLEWLAFFIIQDRFGWLKK
ncbi:hypothetical protein [Enterococcus phoeniculicola]|uniref:Uncharacterized protein n=1 Tax=Enterococcus phoeniculicola ATCC BAA-412 TaxID=1158610 RepID=R3TNC0_9ENTE|nr:hypothetical protein [Enterococcus phoeniculicola]EOL42984.1 hypothetical protein UC3_01961 [Enterococcus phoeniculicola ATCC BAA-412]EOT76658.1 hypothetical protein I589_01615 [Enterococcus phoeniculicola ATCC BAA-412]